MNLTEMAESIEAVVDYGWADEMRDYRTSRRSGDIEANDERHIFTHMVKLWAWATGRNETAESMAFTEEEE